MWYYIYYYVIFWHPIYWLIHQAFRYTPGDMDNAFWPVFAIFGIPAYIALTRYFAETIGRGIGNMYFWWIFFAVFHIWGIPLYGIWYLIASSSRKHWQTGRQRQFADHPQKASWSDAIQEQPPPSKKSRRRLR